MNRTRGMAKRVVQATPSAPEPLQSPAFRAALDPRRIPAMVETMRRLPAIPDWLITADGLRQRFAHDRPWQPEPNSEPIPPGEPIAAAVLMGLIPGPTGLELLLTQRSAELPSHSGQIALPGGKKELPDTDLVHTALREASEEVALPEAAAEVLGTLPVYLTGSGFAVTPVVALLPEDFRARPDPAEVAAVFRVPLSFLMDPRHHGRHRAVWRGQLRTWFSMLYAPAQEDGLQHQWFIWGVTAAIIRDLYRFLAAGEAL